MVGMAVENIDDASGDALFFAIHLETEFAARDKRDFHSGKECREEQYDSGLYKKGVHCSVGFVAFWTVSAGMLWFWVSLTGNAPELLVIQ